MDDENTRNEFHYKSIRLIRLSFAVFTVCLGAFYIGGVIAYPSSALLTLDDPTKKIHALPGSSEQSWIGSLVFLGSIPSAVFTGSLADKFGRKKAMWSASVLGALGCALVSGAQEMWMMYLGRLVSGLSQGMFLMVIPIYIAEISPPSLRGFMGTFFTLEISLGVAVMYALGIWLDWMWCSICLVFPLAAMTVVLFFIPETPYWLAQKNRHEETYNSMSWFYVTDQQIRHISVDNNSEHNNIKPGMRSLFRRDLIHPLIIITVAMFFKQWTGLCAITTYQSKISAGNLSPAVFATIAGVAQTVLAIPSAMLVDRMGRRPLLVFSGLVQFVGMTALVIYYRLFENGEDVKDLATWLPLTGILVYFLGNAIGFAPVPWVLNAEYFGTENRGLACGLTATLNNIFAFSSILWFDDIIEIIGQSGLFGLYGGLSLVSCIFVLLFVVETSGKSLEEINRSFKNGKIFHLPCQKENTFSLIPIRRYSCN